MALVTSEVPWLWATSVSLSPSASHLPLGSGATIGRPYNTYSKTMQLGTGLDLFGDIKFGLTLRVIKEYGQEYGQGQDG